MHRKGELILKLNLDFYQEKEEQITPQEQEIIQKYISQTDGKIYEEQFPEELTDKEVYFLSSSSQNILNWYPFKKEDTILEIGGDLGQLTQIFVDNAQEVVTMEPNLIKAKAISQRYKQKENLEVIVGNIKQIKLEKKFDYIILVGIVGRVKEIMGEDTKLMQLLKALEPYLAENGKYIVAVDNKFGLRYFSGNPDNEPEKIETFTKARLERKIEEIGYHANFYYPLPDYKMPNVIFSDKQLPQYTSVDKYNTYCTDHSTILMNEIDIFREILKDNQEMFPFFANSFLLEIAKQPEPIKYKYISFNNIRKQSYRLITKIAEGYVEKQVVNDQANNHYNHIKRNIKMLEEQGIKTVDYEENGTIKSRYIDQNFLFHNVLTKALEEQNQEKVNQLMNQYIETLKINTYQESDYQKTVFGELGIEIQDPDCIKDLHFQKNGLWDMTFKNCFYIDGELYFFDQEWNTAHLPMEYILYRSILYTISLKRFIHIEDWFEKYQLMPYQELFQKLDDTLQEEIRDHKMWKFYSRNKEFDIDATQQEMMNLNIRGKAQQAAMENLQKEKEEIQKEYETYKKQIEQRITNKIYRKIKGVIGGKHE